jgi:hypothetical protein
MERRRRVEEWLATGEAWVDSNPRHFVRDHIRTEQQHRCLICGQSEEWNGSPLTLVLDHIDGDSSNNRRENLRLVCPNCDSQLPTFKVRNKGKGRHSRRQRYADGKSY